MILPVPLDGRRSTEVKETEMALHRWMTATVTVGVLALGAAACGDDDDAAQAQAPEVATTAPSDATSAATEPATVVDVAAGNADFSTLVTAVQSADLVATLSSPGPFTVFAPVNEAFAALPAGTLDSLLMPENKAQLTSILTYHVVPGKVLSSDLTDGMSVTTVEGQTLSVGMGAGGVTLTDASGNTVSVAKADIEAGNGVVHVIDGVLLPTAG
jgi:uncharacterized surface protein with fasciclin (FAS1) repeats